MYGSDGKHGGRVEAVGAQYVTIAAGLLGQKEFHLPLSLIARADADRVDLTLPLIDAQAQAFKDIPPPDEPIYQAPRPISAEERGAVGMPVAEREDFGIGTRRPDGE